MNSEKEKLRKAARNRRSAAHGAVDPAPALARLHRILDNTAGPVSFYWPIRSEMDPRPLMEELAKTREVCLPVTHGRDAPLTFRRWAEGVDMVTDGFGVSVPVQDDCFTPRVLVVPLLAFDSLGHRLGYGAGHYDRTLEGLRSMGKITAIGLAYSAQRVEKPLPAETTDQALDAIVTELGVLVPR